MDLLTLQTRADQCADMLKSHLRELGETVNNHLNERDIRTKNQTGEAIIKLKREVDDKLGAALTETAAKVDALRNDLRTFGEERDKVMRSHVEASVNHAKAELLEAMRLGRGEVTEEISLAVRDTHDNLKRAIEGRPPSKTGVK